LKLFVLDDFEQEVGVSACGFATRFDATLILLGANKAEGEAADGRQSHGLG
jgi:hypothetical protein